MTPLYHIFRAFFCASLPLAAFIIDFIVPPSHTPAPWRLVAAALAAMQLLPLLGWAYLPESPRHLVAVHDAAALHALLARIARANGRAAPTVEHEDDALCSLLGTRAGGGGRLGRRLSGSVRGVQGGASERGSGVKQGGGLRYLMSGASFHGRSVLLTTCVLFVSAYSCATMYFALSLASGQLAGSLYLNTAINYLVQMPGSLALAPLCEYAGRRVTMAGSLGVGGFLLLLLVAIEAAFGRASTAVATTGIAFVAELAASITFSVVFIVVLEVLPTPARASGVSVCSIAARLGGITAPFALALGRANSQLLFGGLAAGASITCMLWLPETMGVPLE